MTTVANDETAIGYISLGSLDGSVKALTIGGVAPSADTVKDGSYTLARPFNIVTNGEPTDELAVDFINYCMSAEGQALATEEGYIGTDGAAAFGRHAAGRQHHGGRFYLGQPADGKADRRLPGPQPRTPPLS